MWLINGGYLMNGIFITFEGPEGAGKTTIIQMIAQELEKRQV